MEPIAHAVRWKEARWLMSAEAAEERKIKIIGAFLLVIFSYQ